MDFDSDSDPDFDPDTDSDTDTDGDYVPEVAVIPWPLILTSS